MSTYPNICTYKEEVDIFNLVFGGLVVISASSVIVSFKWEPKFTCDILVVLDFSNSFCCLATDA